MDGALQFSFSETLQVSIKLPQSMLFIATVYMAHNVIRALANTTD